jgi:hypothetical protein
MRFSKSMASVAVLTALAVPATAAFAQEGGLDCNDATITVVDSAEHVVHHDAVTHTVSHPAGTERVLYNWTGGPVENPSADADGWHATSGNHNGGPFQGRTDGVPFHVGNGNGDWFMFNTVVVTPAYDEVIVDAEAYDELVPAVTHEEANPAYPCDDPGDDPGETPGGGGVAGEEGGHASSPASSPAVAPVLVKSASTSGELPFTR